MLRSELALAGVADALSAERRHSGEKSVIPIAPFLLAIGAALSLGCAGPDTTSPTDSDSAADVELSEADVADGDLPGAESCISDFSCSFGLVCERDECVELACSTREHCLVGTRACVVVESKSVCAQVECGCVDCQACELGSICNNGKCEP